MRGISRITASALALTIAACDKPQSSEPEVQPEPPVEELGGYKAAGAIEAAAAFEKQAAENAAASAKFLEDNARRDGVKTAENGLQYLVLEEGAKDGVSPKSGDLVDIEYVGTLKDGVEFDSSGAQGAAARFLLGDDLPGWTKGIEMMREGARYRFFVPAALAYGEKGAPPAVGPNEAVIFEVELLKVHSAEKNLAAAEKFLSENAGKDGVKTTASGLQYQVISEGPEGGATPTAADVVRVHYQGTLINGTEFDSSYTRGEPTEFPVGRVIAGWTEGLQLMSEGDKFRFFIAPDLAYKDTGTPGGPIGPNEALIFEVELIAVK